jgi:RNA polymerase III transcription factor (TF)IIIC subunit HTH domain
MWIRNDVQEAIHQGLRFAAIESLPLVAYTIMNGPWRNYWVRGLVSLSAILYAEYVTSRTAV